MWSFKKKREPRVIHVPEDKVEELYQAFDKWQNYSIGCNHHGKYLFWSKCAEMFPELKEGVWDIVTERALRIKFVEVTN